jgi:excisionase family DNA binding protein
MSAPHPRQQGAGHPPAAEALVPPQATAPESAPPAERLAYSVDEAARLTGLSRDLLYDEMRHGHLDYYIKAGSHRLITRWHLEQFLQISPVPQPPVTGTTASGHKAHDGAP